MEFDWDDVGASKVQWAAFYSDCEHEVLEVKSGHRITLTYNLLVSESNPLGSLEPKKFPLYQTFDASLQQPGFIGNGKNDNLICVTLPSWLTID